jgi:FG-GAP-like repeat
VCGALIASGCGGNHHGGGGDGGDGDGGAGNPDGPTPDGGAPTCTVSPTGQFNPQVECRWDTPPAGTPYAKYDDVVSTPVVINLTDDNGDGKVDLSDIPDIAFVAYRYQEDGCCNQNGVLRVVSGSCGADGILAQHYVVGANEIEADIGVAGVWLDNSGGLAAGDIDGDGSVDLVATTNHGGTIAFERDGHVKWYQPDYPTGDDHLAGTQPALADLDGDGHPEVIQGRVVLNGADGSLKWAGTAGLGTNGFMGPVSSLGDLDRDGQLDLLAGNTMYDAGGTARWSYTYATPITMANCKDQGYPCDGFTATGNFDSDADGEVVIVRAGVIYILKADGSPLMVNGAPVQITIPKDDCALNEGGPPTVADFDGDGQPEIGVAAADYYVVADLECLADPLPAQCSDPGIRWKTPNFDCSSRVTGSSVFDFDGDGRAEVAYADEQSFRILDGVDGHVRLMQPNTSHTRLEMPIIVDTDNDGNAEIVYVENAYNGTTQGIRVMGDATDSWSATRRVWNQHSYHVTNVTELGAIPQHEPINWLEPTSATQSHVMNDFRQNLPETDALAAPDLRVMVSLDDVTCSIVANVCNEGDIVAGAGVPVTFWNPDGTEIQCTGGPVATTQPLQPGACEAVSCGLPSSPDGTIEVRACVDNGGFDCAGDTGQNRECDEGNNLDDTSGDLHCQVIG